MEEECYPFFRSTTEHFLNKSFRDLNFLFDQLFSIQSNFLFQFFRSTTLLFFDIFLAELWHTLIWILSNPNDVLFSTFYRCFRSTFFITTDKATYPFFDQQPNIFWINVFEISFIFSINFFKSESIFYFNFFDQLPFSFLNNFLTIFDSLFTTKISNKKHTFLS